MTESDHRGHGLIEAMAAMALLALAVTWSVPALVSWAERRAVWAEATGLALQVQALRAAAALDGRYRGVVFSAAPTPGWTAVRDGDGDGIATADITAGIDDAVMPRHELRGAGSRMSWRLPESVAPVAGGNRPQAAVPFAPAAILSLAPDGGTSTGTIYLCTTTACAAVRAYGPGGRLALWELRGDRWRRRW